MRIGFCNRAARIQGCAQQHRLVPEDRWTIVLPLPALLPVRRTNMLLAVIVLTTLITVVIRSRLRVRGSANPGGLGWMSEQWVAEYRASHTQ